MLYYHCVWTAFVDGAGKINYMYIVFAILLVWLSRILHFNMVK